MSEQTPNNPTNIHGHVVGSAADGGTVNARNIAGGDIHEHHHYAPEAEKPTFPIHEIAHPQNPNFTGRAQILQQVEAALSAGQTTVVTQTIAGLGGVGKTQLALAYSYAHLSRYDLIYWLSADSEPGLGEGLMALARRLKLIAPEATDQKAAVQAMLLWLGQTNKRWLLVYDNADQIEPAQLTRYLPRTGNGHVLITSRNPNYGGVGQVLELGLFELDEAVDFLFRRKGAKGQKIERKSKEWREAADLAEALGRLPLALEHAAAYVESKSSSFVKYHQLFTERQNELWQRAEQPERYHATITTTWELAFDEIKKTPGALDLLNLCCFFYPENISLDLLVQVANIKTQYSSSLHLLSTDRLAMDDAIGALRRYSLIQRVKNVLSLHPLVQMVIRNSLTQSSKESFASLALQTLVTSLKDRKYSISYPFVMSHLDFVIDHIIKGKKVLSIEFVSSSADVKEFLQYSAEFLNAQETNLGQVKSLYSDIRVSIYKLAEIDAEFFSHPESSINRIFLSNFHRQYQSIQNDLKAAEINTQNADLFEIPNVFSKSEQEQEIVEVLETVNLRLSQIDIMMQMWDKLAEKLPYVKPDLTFTEINERLNQHEKAQELFVTAIGALNKGDFAKAVQLMHEAMINFEHLLGAEHPNTIGSRRIIDIIEKSIGKGILDKRKQDISEY